MDYQIQTLIAEKQEQANTITALKNRIKELEPSPKKKLTNDSLSKTETSPFNITNKIKIQQPTIPTVQKFNVNPPNPLALVKPMQISCNVY